MIRAARPDDVPAIVRLVQDLAEYERARHEATATDADLDRALFGPSPAVFCDVAEVDGEVVGFALWFLSFSTWLGRHGIYLNNSAYAVVGGDRAPDGSLALGDLISGNHCAGVKIKGGLAANNTVIGSNIGPDVTGHFGIGNQIGIEVEGAPNTVIGAAGDDAGKKNVCGFNMGPGTTTLGNINTKLAGTSPPNTVILGFSSRISGIFKLMVMAASSIRGRKERHLVGRSASAASGILCKSHQKLSFSHRPTFAM